MISALADRIWPLARAALFRLDAEVAHERTIAAIEAFPGLFPKYRSDPSLSRTIAGLRFPAPVGLAAGLDKDGRAIPFWPRLGFGSVEVGTVTAFPQAGNPRPRLFRLPADRALVNRMGFNNGGSALLAARLLDLRESGRWPSVPVGANVGKSKITLNERAVDDYTTSIRRLRGLADYIAVNVSSPNTPGLRDLQSREALSALLPAAVEAARGTPVFLKLSPDLSDDDLEAAVDTAVSAGISAILATNTTLSREGLSRDPGEAGGLSGEPLRPLALRKVGVALRAASGRLPVIGVGGISTAAHVRELLDAGCAAVQLYTALIYEGPGLPRRIHEELTTV